jgi:hypothetical protein
MSTLTESRKLQLYVGLQILFTIIAGALIGAVIAINIQAINDGSDLTGIVDFLTNAPFTSILTGLATIAAVGFGATVQKHVIQDDIDDKEQITVNFGSDKTVEIPAHIPEKEYEVNLNGDTAEITIKK